MTGELGPNSKKRMFAMIPPYLKAEAEEWIKDQIAKGEMVWIANEGVQSCKA